MTDFNALLNQAPPTAPKPSFTPTPQQQDFIDELANGNSNILLSAVAGSGKTATLVAACNALKGGNVLALAFNAKIAKELTERLPSFATCKTMNALGHAALIANFGKIKIDARKMGRIATEFCNEYDLQDCWGEMRNLCAKAKSHGLVPNRFAPTVANVMMESNQANWLWLADNYSIDIELERPKTNDTAIMDAWRKRNEQHVKLLIEVCDLMLYESCRMLMEEKIADFDDQIFFPVVLALPMKQYPLVLVDEAQDLSMIQHIMITNCLTTNGRLVAVGDPRQAIYGFRGADAASMANLKAKFNMIELPLTHSFRCGKAIISQAQKYVPYITAPESAHDGEVEHLPSWQPKDLKHGSVIVCRNVFPLVSLGYRCINQGIGVHILGRDIGANLKKLAKKLYGEDSKEILESIELWRSNENVKAKANEDLDKLASIEDNADTLGAILHYSKAQSVPRFIAAIDALFAPDSGNLTLCTIHRSKGLEWDTVYFLDSFRVPSKYATKDWQIEQEMNLKYIAVTRAINSLIYIEGSKK